MKIGDIAYNAYVTALVVPFIAGVAYFIVAGCATFVQERKYDFESRVEARGLEYKGRKPYNPLMPLLNQDRNGYAEAWLRGNDRVFLRYDDLTAPSLEYRILVTNSKGEKAEFNDKTEYDEKTLEGISKLTVEKDIVEQKIKEVIAKK